MTRDRTGRGTERDEGRDGRAGRTDGRDGRAARAGGTNGRDGRAEGRWGGGRRGGRKGGEGRTDGALVLLKAAPFHLFKAVSGLTQKMWVRSEGGEVKSQPPVGHFKNLLPGFGTLILNKSYFNNYWIINKQLLLFPSPTRTVCVGTWIITAM